MPNPVYGLKWAARTTSRLQRNEQERQHILNAVQRNILQMLGVDESKLESMLDATG
ncbi:hypothetical protein OCT51_09270 [Halomonas sp. LR3S48]|uniref:hypothetical protein n=1 Tax=Halomonadaceae TaxID=28256 RepID=UPI0021E3F105|nr:hypothetical protein [Halomonas sp. LR3S48]UYG05532.1 hypothetical protein OCT51_09270 [Halomonas sp. LR3S48]